MPSREPVRKSELTNEVSSFLDKKRRETTGAVDGDVEFISVLDFIDKFKLLPDGLFPVQRFILKMYYGIPLDPINKIIKITDMFNKKVIRQLTEVEYLKYLYDHKRCNIKEQDDTQRKELILILGRRSGKSLMSSIVCAYEIYKLLRRGSPQRFYGAPNGSEIRVVCVANDKEQASIVYGDMQSYIEASDYFKNSIANSNQTLIRFRTDGDKERFPDNPRKGTITATFKSSIAKGLRGRGVMCAVFDEIAFFEPQGRSSAENIYKAMNPSIAQFSPKEKGNRHVPIGPSDGRVMMISSPDAKDGFFYKMYQLAMSNGPAAKNTLVIQAPTWEVNPTLSSDYYEVAFHKDSTSFMTEHGAEFSNRVRGWIEDHQDLTACIDPELRPAQRGVPRDPHWAGIDFSISGDGTSVALTHIKNGKIELAYHEVWYPKTPWKEANPHLDSHPTNYATKLSDVTRFDLDELSDWILALSKRFYIVKGVFDQYAGGLFEMALHKRGLTQFETRYFSTNDSSHIYNTFKMFMMNNQLSIYDYPVSAPDDVTLEDVRHSPLIEELLELQATSGGKNILIVEKPNIAGKHDDMSDALARSVFLASEYVKENPGILESSISGIGFNGGNFGGRRIQPPSVATKKRNLGKSFSRIPARRVPMGFKR